MQSVPRLEFDLVLILKHPKLGIYTMFILNIYILKYLGSPNIQMRGPKVTLT